MKNKKCTCNQYDKWGLVCPSCSDKKQSIEFKPNVIQKVYLEHYGNVSKGRIDELNRRYLAKDYHGKGKHQLCRVGENGKLQERYPDYY